MHNKAEALQGILQVNALTWSPFSPLQGEGRGFETLSAHHLTCRFVIARLRRLQVAATPAASQRPSSRLAQPFDRIAAELRELIEEQDAMVPEC